VIVSVKQQLLQKKTYSFLKKVVWGLICNGLNLYLNILLKTCLTACVLYILRATALYAQVLTWWVFLLYFSAILRDILTTMETIKHQQQMILLQLQTTRQPMEVPDVSGIPLTSLDELIKLEESIASQVEYKRKLVGECSCICWIDIC